MRAFERGRSKVSMPVSIFYKSLDFDLRESNSNLGFYGDFGNGRFMGQKCGTGLYGGLSNGYLKFLDWEGLYLVFFQTQCRLGEIDS